jgi:ADP-heptose:LPS heptosyltransferase
VTVFSSYPGAEVVEHDPNIDNLVIFDRDQVPNQNLVDFWDWQKKKFDKWVQLSETVEGTLLAMKGRTPMYFHPKLREELLDHNYVEFQHRVGNLPIGPKVKFYNTAEEKAWALKERERLGLDSKVVMWSLAGSAVHKTWAGLDNIIARTLLEFPRVRFVLVGGPECLMLEAGWEKEPRVICKSGKWSIRQTLSFALKCDLIIGPETGVLNAVAMEEMPKIVFLSHSTVNNLTRDWANTHSLWSKNTKCAGRGNNEAKACHQLHYGWDFCTQDTETGTAQCQKDIQVDEVWEVVEGILKG